MEQSPNLGLAYIAAAQAQKHVTHNESIRALDALVQLAVQDRDLSTPPAAPADGARYIVGPAATGTWVGQAGRIAAFQDGAWAFYAPVEGWIAWIADEDMACVFDGTAWVAMAGGGSVNPAPLVGVNATADTTNRLSVAAPATLFSHAGAGHQMKLNKATAADTASMVFQTGFSGRAEIGLAGDNDLHLKVSPDGTAWTDALTLIGATGTPRLPAFTVATLPSATSAGPGAIVYVSDEGGGATPAFSDGSSWRRYADRTVVSRGLPLLIFAGESNAGGLAVNADATAPELAARSSVRILDNTTLAWADLDVGTNNLVGHFGLPDNATHGLEIGLANTVDAGRWPNSPPQIYLVKTGQGGSVIAEWATGHSSGYWSTFLSRVNAAKGLLQTAGVGVTPIVFYSQGINDALLGVPTPVATWKSQTIAHLAKIRSELGATTPIYMTRFAAPPLAASDTAYNVAMDEIAAADSYTKVLDTAALGIVNTHHWSYQGYLALAERLLDEINGAAGTLAAPTFLPAAGSYGSAQSVTLTGPSGASIRYTLDGSEPSSHSPLYTGPIAVAVTTTVKAIAQHNGYRNSATAAAAYTIAAASATWSTSDAAAGSFTLTGSDRTAQKTAGSAGAWKTVRATQSRAAGKFYFEIKVAVSSSNNFTSFGLANAAFSAAAHLGSSAASLGVTASFIGNTDFTVLREVRAPTSQTAGVTIGLAVDLDTGKVWIAHDNVWQLTGDPAAGANPFATFTPATVGALFPALSIYDPTAGAFTLQTAAVEQTYTPPSGFASWV